jgi:hemerythrin
MAHLKWSSDLDIGVELIDEQHKRIVKYINELYDAQRAKDATKAGEVIEDLVDYTVSHFSFEESMMEQANYPFLAAHQKVHALFIKRVGKYIERYEAGEDIVDELLVTLQKWLINHIRNEDGDYGPAVRASIKKQGVEGGWFSRFRGKMAGK